MHNAEKSLDISIENSTLNFIGKCSKFLDTVEISCHSEDACDAMNAFNISNQTIKQVVLNL